MRALSAGRLMLALFWLVAPGAGAALACSCAKANSPCASFRTSEAVFVGTVRSVTPVEQAGVVLPLGRGAGGWRVEKSAALSVSFGVDEPLKGVNGAGVELITAPDTAACGYPFEVGESYLVFAYRWKDAARGAGTGPEPPGLPDVPARLSRSAEELNKPLSGLATSICTRTRHLSRARDDLELIRAQSAGRPQTRVFGWVSEYVRKLGTYEHETALAGPLASVTVEAAGPAGRFEGVTDAEGRYSVAGLPPGKYKVRPLLPETHGLLFGGKAEGVEVVVSAERCGAELSFAAEVDGRVSGRVYDSAGRPAGKDVQVSLVTLDSARKGLALAESRSESTDAESRYEFDGVPPGQYVLGVNIADPPDRDTPYPPTYYPEGGDVERAAVVTLTAGQKLRDHDLRLPPPLAAGRVAGVVLLPGGRPAAGATVYLYDREDASKDAHGLDVETDRRGRFSAPCYKARRYLARAVVYLDSPGGGALESEKVEAACGDTPAPLRLTLRREAGGGAHPKEEGKEPR